MTTLVFAVLETKGMLERGREFHTNTALIGMTSSQDSATRMRADAMRKFATRANAGLEPSCISYEATVVSAVVDRDERRREGDEDRPHRDDAGRLVSVAIGSDGVSSVARAASAQPLRVPATCEELKSVR